MKLGFKTYEKPHFDDTLRFEAESNLLTLEHNIFVNDDNYLIFKINTDQFCFDIIKILKKFILNAKKQNFGRLFSTIEYKICYPEFNNSCKGGSMKVPG